MQLLNLWRQLLTKLGLRFFQAWYAPAVLGGVLVLALVIWALPRRVEKFVAVDTQHEWQPGSTPPRRQFVWDTPLLIDELLPQSDAILQMYTPRLTDGGNTLYFTLRKDDGSADIYRSRRSDGIWQPASAVDELNSAFDDIGPALSADGRLLCFYSNRPGGAGGFDLYLSERSNQGWSAPVNLGPGVNSPADEYDPALHVAADRLSLFFASNRDPDAPAESARELPGLPPAIAPPGGWLATLRAYRTSPQFDLYVSRRETGTQDWAAPALLKGISLPAANEGAPFVTPAGTYLYFSSDRRARRGEKPNLDLYRARISGERFGPVENLGTGINTAGDETEPGLSPEGQVLLFASDRDGIDGLYRSLAQEVYVESGWDSTRWKAFTGIWWRALLLALIVAAAVGMFWFGYRWVARKASAGRFVSASIAFHVLLVLVMWKTPLGETVVEMVQEIRAKADELRLFDDNLHQSHVAGTESYERVADLKSLEAIPEQESFRQVTELPNVPVPIENRGLVPTVPVQVAQSLPANRVLFAPPPAPQQVLVPQELKRQTRPPVQMAAAGPELQELPEPVAPAVETPVENKMVDVAREVTVAVANPAGLPPRTRGDRVLRPPVIELDLVEQPEAPEIKGAEPAPEAALRGPLPQPAPPTDDLTVLDVGAAVPMSLEQPPLAAADTPLERKELEPTPPDASIARPVRQAPGLTPRPPALEKPADLPVDLAALPLMVQDPAHRQPDPFTRAEPASRVPDQPDPVETETLPVPMPMEQPLEVEVVNVVRPEPLTVQADVRLPPELTGPRTAVKPLLIVGTLADEAIDDPPSLSPLANALTRMPARATPVAYAEDNVGLRAMFTLRQGDNRRQFIELFGGNEATEAAVNRGLNWLALHQDEAGSWSLNNFHANCKGKHADCPGAGSLKSDIAATGLALLPFLAAGHTHQEGEYKAVVAKALAWLMANQKPDGQLLAAGDGQPMYSHGLASIALCELYGMSQDPQYRDPAQRALQFIEKAQHAGSGGWRYNPNESGDTSVVGWQVMALKSGEMAGLAVSPAVLDGARRWLASVEANQPTGGMFGYTGASATPTMTAEGLLCLEFLGVRRNDGRMRAGADYLLQNLPDTSNPASTSYYWYYATQTMYHMQGDYWTAWNAKLRDPVVATQITQGDAAGTWTPRDNWEQSGGRIFATSLRLLILEVYYRHLPLYQQLDD